MSTVLTRPRIRAREDLDAQESLFGDRSATLAPPSAPAPAGSPRPHAPAPAASPRPHAPDAPAGPTLEQAITARWAELTAGHTASCPVCGSAMAPGHDAGAGIVSARCTSCATTLA
jgi:hypothetical protein